MLVCFNKWNTIKSSNKTTTSEDFEKMHHVLLSGIRKNIASLVKPGKYGATNETYPTIVRYYLVKYLSYDYALKEFTTCYGNIIMASELVVKAQYPSCTKTTEKCY